MAIQRTLLLIADIGGYTRFMTTNRLALAHAQELVARLLEAVLDGARGLKLAKLEGDAAFLYAPLDEGPARTSLEARLAAIRAAFLREQAELVQDRICTCEACMNVGELKLKFVAHEGEVAFQRVRRNTELAGVDVILVHRMLKNDVPLSEYALFSDAAKAWVSPSFQANLQHLEHDFEGLGPTATHYLDLTAVPAEVTPPSPSLARRLWGLLVLDLKALPARVGLAPVRSR